MKRRILLVDDELAILLTLKAVLEINDFDVETADSAREAKLKLRAKKYHMVITDMRMESTTAGLEVVAAARKAPYKPAVAMLTAFPEPAFEGEDTGADKMLVKPMHTSDLVRQLEALLITHEDQKRKAARSIPKAAPAKPARKTASKSARKAPVPAQRKPTAKAAAPRKSAKKAPARKLAGSR
ncbi:MAG: response regulator [Silvibacterium sp.]